MLTDVRNVSAKSNAAKTLTANVKPATPVAPAVKPQAAAPATKPQAAKAPAVQPAAPAPTADPVREAFIDYSAYKGDALRNAYKAKFGADTKKTWKLDKIRAALTAGAPILNPSQRKEALRVAYKAKTGRDASKTWSADTIAKAIETGRLPGSRKASGGLNAADARKLISAAVSLGIVTRKEANGRSKWKADAVHAFVAKHNLQAMAVAALKAAKGIA